MIGFWLTPFPPFPVSKVSIFQSLPVCHGSSLLTGEGGREWARSRIIRPRENLSLYESFDSLCLCVYQAPLSHFSPSKQTSFCVPRFKKLIMVFIARNFLYKCGFLSSETDFKKSGKESTLFVVFINPVLED